MGTGLEVELRHGHGMEVEGYLKKQNNLLSMKKRRFFKITEQTLFCCHEEGQGPSWEMDLNDVRISGRLNQLRINVTSPDRNLILYASSKEEYDTWFDALQKSALRNVEEFYELGTMIGEGAFAKVFTGLDKNTLEKFAIKVIEKNKTDPQELEFINRELNIMKRVNHPNVVRTYDIFESKDKLHIVMEFMAGATLADVFKAKKEFTHSVRSPYRPPPTLPLTCRLSDHGAGWLVLPRHRNFKKF
uniref:non-specific serine/threonine protein kinase n=2 Tax=Compsopogon caeruleus TaxID=31354 RepID=A0A6T6CJP5_9RHOD|mmetsp:Transcript_807/g.1724  ORF Transcript_807/g.1724 Transcript_807/m.1724 type:complete len:245 (+) Transcript_807:540-1274(+)